MQAGGPPRRSFLELTLSHSVPIEPLDEHRLHRVVAREGPLALLQVHHGNAVQAQQLLRPFQCGQVAAVMPGQGRAVERPYTAVERAALGNAAAILGDTNRPW